MIDVNLHRSRLDGASARPDPAPTLLVSFLAETAARARDVCGDRTVAINFEPGAEQTVLDIDAGLLSLALINLIENSHKFSPLGEPIEVSAARTGSDLTITVADRGIGIPDAEREHLTQRYFRASNSANTSGMGLGLALVSTIAANHGAMLSFANRDGGGTLAGIGTEAGRFQRDSSGKLAATVTVETISNMVRQVPSKSSVSIDASRAQSRPPAGLR